MSCFQGDFKDSDYLVQTVKKNGIWIRNDSLMLHLVQPRASDMMQLIHNLPRPESIYILSEIFKQKADRNIPELILLPELSLGSRDFRIMEALIKDVDYPLIILAGFGYTTGEELRNIVSHNHVHFVSMLQEDDIPHDKMYNGGVCWYNDSKGNIESFLFFKNFSGGIETEAVQNLYRDAVMLRFETEDMVIFPLLCSDIFCSCNKRDALTRIKESLQKFPPSANQKVIITGSISSCHPEHDIWTQSIGSYTLLEPNPLIILANQPEGNFPFEPHSTQFNLTGIFTRKENLLEKEQWEYSPHNIALFSNETSHGIVLMDKTAGAASGRVRWEKGKYLDVFMEHAYTWRDFQLKEITNDADYRFWK